MAIKKTELYSSIWQSCDQLRGNMDASQYKDYVLVLLFVKYVSDKYAGQQNAVMDVPTGGSFTDMIAAKGKPDIGERMNTIIGKLAEANNLKGIIDVANFNDEAKLGKGQGMVDTLSKLVGIFQNPGLDFSRNRAEGDDILGDAYEYLMRHFATESGKSKGQFYTPAEVSRVMARVVGINASTRRDQTVYDPACGSGSLLLKAADEAPNGITIYGQEKDNATTGLALMNMFLHNQPSATVWNDNTLARPYFKDKDNENKLRTFDFIVVNPPFSDKAWTNGVNVAHDPYGRFEDGIPPAKNGDYAFLLHVVKSMKSTGKGAIIMPHGVLFRGGAEADIRRKLLKRGIIKGIIGLPPNLFYGTGIPACIIILDKEQAATRKDIFMIDASKGFMKDGNKNRLRHQDIHKIVDTFNRQLVTDKYSRIVPLAEIADPKNDYNLNIPRYIDSTEPEDLQDIDGHLRGGIPNRDVDALEPYWNVCPTLKDKLFGPADRKGYSQVRIESTQIKPTIYKHPEFVTFTNKVHTLFDKWQKQNMGCLQTIEPCDHPRTLINTISENLLAVFGDVPLIDKYDVYQHLMSYWADTMQDDVYMIVSDGWVAVDQGKPNTDLIPQTLIVSRYFSKEKTAIDGLQAEEDALISQREELEEEQGGEEGLLADAKNDKDKLTKASIKARMTVIKSDRDAVEERKILNEYLALIEKESTAGKKIKDAQKDLDARVAAQYGRLTEKEIKVLIVEDKWLATLAADVRTELDRVSQALAGRVKQLAERYAIPLPKIEDEVEDLSAKVEGHLTKMGFAWK